MTRNIHGFIISDGEKVGLQEQMPVTSCCDIKTGNGRDVEQFLLICSFSGCLSPKRVTQSLTLFYASAEYPLFRISLMLLKSSECLRIVRGCVLQCCPSVQLFVKYAWMLLRCMAGRLGKLYE